MPFKSEAQRRLFHAMADRGEISEEKVREWEHATKNKKKLPEHVHHKKHGSEAALKAFGVKVAELPHYVAPMAKHFAMGAIPSAVAAYMASGKDPQTGEDHSLRNALMAGAAGGLGGVGVGAARQYSKRTDALNKKIFRDLSPNQMQDFHAREEAAWNQRNVPPGQAHPGLQHHRDTELRARDVLTPQMPLYGTQEQWDAVKVTPEQRATINAHLFPDNLAKA